MRFASGRLGQRSPEGIMSSTLRPAIRPAAPTGRLLAWSLVVSGLLVSFSIGFLAAGGPVVIELRSPERGRPPAVMAVPLPPHPQDGHPGACGHRDHRWRQPLDHRPYRFAAPPPRANRGGGPANQVGEPTGQPLEM
jgi:hypothetical protein